MPCWPRSKKCWRYSKITVEDEFAVVDLVCMFSGGHLNDDKGFKRECVCVNVSGIFYKAHFRKPSEAPWLS